MRKNTWKLYLFEATSGSIFFVAIIVPFLQENGLSLQQVFILQGFFSVLVLLFEIPSGYLSDRWGRKTTLLIGSLAYLLGVSVYSLGSTMWMFLVAEFFWAIARSSYSGNVDALTYDTLLELKETSKYRRINGLQRLFYFGSEAAGSVLGGLLAVVSLRTPVVATLVPFALSTIVVLTLTEPRRRKMQGTQHFKMMLTICRKTLIHNVPLRSIIALTSIIATMSLALFWLTQPYQASIGLPLAFFGVAHAIIVGAGAVAAAVSHRISRWIDDRIFLLLIAITVIGSFIAIGFVSAIWGLVFFLFVRVCWGFLSPLVSDIINRMTTSDVRATTLSVFFFALRSLFVISAPILGYFADIFTINQTILLTGLIGGSAITIVLFLMRNVWREIPK